MAHVGTSYKESVDLRMSHCNRLKLVQLNYTLRMLAACAGILFAGCQRPVRIAVIPRTTGVMLWEAEHSGAVEAARKYGFQVYWNAPTREDDLEGQIALLQRIRAEKFDGLVLAPDQALALMTPVRNIVAAHIPTVIVSSPLPLPIEQGLSYILNNDSETGRIAATRLSRVLGTTGTVGLISLDPNLMGLMAQVRAFDETLASVAPRIQIVDRRLGAFNAAEVQQITSEMLNRHPNLDAIVSFTAVATRGAFLTLQKRRAARPIKLIACEQDADIIAAVERGEIDSVVAEDAYQMGYQAIQTIAAMRQGAKLRQRILLRPLLITRENVNSPQVRRALHFGWSDTN